MDDLEEDYSSSDDSDYVPEAAVSDSDSGEEDKGENDEEGDGKKRGKKTKKDSQLKRKRKGGIKLEGEDDDDIGEKRFDEEQEQKELEQERKALDEEEKRARELEEEEKEKKRADDLWKSLLSDVGPRPKASSSATSVSKISSSAKNETAKEVAPGEKGDATKSNQKTIKVTETFDFAGEEVKVTKDVAVNSKEAEMVTKKPEQSTKQNSGQLPIGVKRKPGGIGSVLGKLNKKPKISVLEKSKLDWDTFKKKEGIDEDLRIHNKGKEGFLQKQDFLRETDLRQYEIERKMRLGKSGR